MADERVKKLAEIICNWSIRIKKGDIISISSKPEAKALILEIIKIILKKGAMPKLNIGLDGFDYTFYKYASKEQLHFYPKIAEFEAKATSGNINIVVDNNTRELSSIDPQNIAIRRKTTYPISKIIVDRNNWVLTEFPTNALAQDAEMSLEEFEDFYYGACIIDYKKMDDQQTQIKRLFDKASNVKIIGKDTHLTLSIKGRQGIKCSGKRNIPDGEVFCAPVETSLNGKISYSFPAIYSGREVDGIKLEFKDGKVINATAKKNESLLKRLIDTDKGSRYVGEFAIGLNYNIQKNVKQILFDEKIGGSIHLALGMAYKEGGGKNESALHWDMIKDMRPAAGGGEIYFDNKLIYKDGKFVMKL